MPAPAFLITVDAEGDDAWTPTPQVATRNGGAVARFQDLAARHGLPVTYLVDHAMLADEPFMATALDARDAGTADIGMHLHAWSTPPIAAGQRDDWRHTPFLTDYDEAIMAAKVGHVTDALVDAVGARPRSHRGGRYALDDRYLRLLRAHGYVVDSSVTPHISWRGAGGLPGGPGGPDYRRSPEHPHRLGGLLEVPVTIRWRPRRGLPGGASWARHVPGLRQPEWLRPGNGAGEGDRLAALLERVAAEGGPAVFMLHSSELLPGGSPTFRSAADVDRLYGALEMLFAAARRLDFAGHTLSSFAAQWGDS